MELFPRENPTHFTVKFQSTFLENRKCLQCSPPRSRLLYPILRHCAAGAEQRPAEPGALATLEGKDKLGR